MRPFTRGSLSGVFEENNQKLKKYINKYSDDEIMANDLDLLAENCYETLKIESISIGDEDISMRSAQIRCQKCKLSFIQNRKAPCVN